MFKDETIFLCVNKQSIWALEHLYDKNKLIVITDFYLLLRLQQIRFPIANLTNLIKKIKTLHDIENLLQCLSNLKLF